MNDDTFNEPRVREPHSDKHNDWDQGGYCNTLVQDENGDGDICGYRQALSAPAPEVSVRVDSRIPGKIEISEWVGGGARSSIRIPRELLGDLREAIQVAEGVDVVGGVLAMVLEEPTPPIEPATGVLCMLTEGNDMEAHATWFNDGFSTAVAQGLADDPALASDWLDEQREDAALAALVELVLSVRPEGEVPFLRQATNAVARHMGYSDDEIAAVDAFQHGPDVACWFEANTQSWECLDEDGNSHHPQVDQLHGIDGTLRVALEDAILPALAAQDKVLERKLRESSHRFDPIDGMDPETACALCGLDPEASPHQQFERLFRAVDQLRALAPEEQPDVLHDEAMLEGYRLALADMHAILDYHVGPVAS